MIDIPTALIIFFVGIGLGLLVAYLTVGKAESQREDFLHKLYTDPDFYADRRWEYEMKTYREADAGE